MDKKREQELREQYRIWKEEEIKWQEEERRRQEEERRRQKEEKIAKLLYEYTKTNSFGMGVVVCPWCKGRGYTLSRIVGYPDRPCGECHRSGKLDPKNPEDKKQLIRFFGIGI